MPCKYFTIFLSDTELIFMLELTHDDAEGTHSCFLNLEILELINTFNHLRGICSDH
jgi:hypothetical protein